MNRFINIIVIILICTCVSTNGVFADIFNTYGFGPKGSSMSDAVCSLVEDSDSVYYNPAGLGKNKNVKLMASHFSTFADTRINFTDPEYFPELPDSKSLEFGAVLLGLAVNLNTIVDVPRNLSFGLGLSTMDDFKLAAVYDVEESHYRYIQFGSSLKLTTVYFGIGMEIIQDILWAGIGGHAMLSASTTLSLDAKTEILSTDESNPTIPKQNISLEAEPNLSPTLGLIYNLNDRITLGGSYKHKIWFDIYDIIIPLDLYIGSVYVEIPIQLELVANWVPSIYQFGGSYKTGNVTFAFDIRHEKWSEFERGNLRENRFINDTDLDPLDARPPFDDIISCHFGVDYKYSDTFHLWSGLANIPSPIPEQLGGRDGGTNYLGNDRYVVSCGGEKKFENGLGKIIPHVYLGGSFRYQQLKKRTVKKTNGYDYNHKGNIISILLTTRIEL